MRLWKQLSLTGGIAFVIAITSFDPKGAQAQQVNGGQPAGASDAGAAPTTTPVATSVTASGSASADAGEGTIPVSSATPPSELAAPAKKVVQLPAPSAGQLAALDALAVETGAYERSAKDYRDAVTSIVKYHYELRKKEALSTLDRRITYEKNELRAARETAIARLEAFIAKYSGPTADPQATPDAMYRLAALYEEKARGDEAVDDLSYGLKPAIALYKRVINEFPKYKELAGIFYFLGHAYNDSSRTEEAQQVWRALVCSNQYKYPTSPNPKAADADVIIPLPQDNTPEHWTTWRRLHPDPKALKRGGPDVKYIDPYPETCVPVAQPGVLANEEPKYVGEIWWQIGNWEFDNLDMRGGVVADEAAAVWDYNRAASAYQQSMKFKKPPLYGVALYKYSWTLFKQQRYEAATREFVRLLNYTDEQQKLTGDPGADFRGEAYTYIAGSLTNIDFKGPEPEEPYIARPDIVDSEPRPEVAEQKLRIAIDRVKDPALIPQDKPWTIEIYKALAQEFRSLNQFTNAIDVYESILKKWPMDPTAPDVQAAIAETYDQANITKRVGTPEHDANASKALEARTKLANYIGNTPWVEANKENPAAIQNAERLVKGGLRQAAAQHTNNGRQALVDASENGDSKQKVELLLRAQSEYKLAALGWAGFIKQDENAPDVYESKYWLADARHKQVRITVLLHQLNRERYAEPTALEVNEAKAAAVDVRDSTEDDKYLDNAAFFVVEESDVQRDMEYQRFIDTKGSQGIAKREEVRFDSDSPEKKVVKDPIPPSVLAAMQARDEYAQRVPTARDPQKRSIEYLFYVADMYFVYGDFDNARARFEPMYKERCGKDDYGYRAWEKLISMSNMMRDSERSRQLAEEQKAHSCAMSAEQEKGRDFIVNPTLQEAAYVDARKKFQQAKDAPPGPEKAKLWREAAGMYEAALSAAPGRDEAPEAAMNAAYAYKQVGEFTKAIAMYDKFIAEYGSNDRLNTLQKGDAKKGVPPNPKSYQERIGYLGTAYDELGTTYYGFFNYQKAAETYEKVAGNERFDEARRKTAAKNAMILYANMGQREKMRTEYNILVKLHPTADEKANADFLIANFDYGQWNPSGSDSGTNKQTRLQAQQTLTSFYNSNKGNAAASKYALTAAYQAFKLMKVGGDVSYHTWSKNTIAAWEGYKSRAPNTKEGVNEALLPPYADYAAEAEFTNADEEIREKYEGARHKYTGSVQDVIGKTDPKTGAITSPGRYQTNAKDADKYDQLLNHIVVTYRSPEWVPAALARQGSLFDSLRTGLYNAVPPAVKLFSPQQDTLLKQLENSGRDNLIEQADELRSRIKEGWRAKKEQELASADTVMVDRYAKAIQLARAYNVRSASTQYAVSRMAYFTDVIGDEKLRGYVEKVPDPADASHSKRLGYTNGQYVQQRPGLTAVPPSSGGSVPEAPLAP